MDKKEFLKCDDATIAVAIQYPERRREAFECIVDSYKEDLYWTIRRMVLSHEDASDVLQNTFVKAWMNLACFRAEARISTWLYRIAINESLTFLSEKRVSLSLDDPEGGVSQLESDCFFSGDEAELKLQKAILTLPEKQRAVFHLKYFDEMKYKEMSEIFGTTVGALKASYHHAVKKIIEYITSN